MDPTSEKSTEFEELKIQGQEVNITTPENKTYTTPMSGYYPATYGFEDETDGTSDTDIGFIDVKNAGSGTFTIKSEASGHRKVLEVYDSGSQRCDGYNNFEAQQPNGTIEFYMKIEDASCAIYMSTNDASGNGQMGVRIYVGAWHLLAAGDWQGFSGPSDPVAGQWYHIRFDFECTTGQYKGLSQWTFYLYIDGVQYGPYDFYYNSQPHRFCITTGTTASNYYSYMDAIGYSWNENYDISDNINEGLLVSLNLGFTPNWLGYSLDYQTNKTIQGNSTINFPDNGIHTIQIFGNNSLGVMNSSDIRYFTVSISSLSIKINAPVDNEFFGPTAPNYDISITGPYDSIWYTLDGGITNITVNTLTGKIKQDEWDKKGDGIVTIIFYVNNSEGLLESDIVQVVKYVTEEEVPPEITINSPIENEFYGATAPEYNISIKGWYDTIWYTIDEGIVNITINELTGSISQTEWDKLGDGIVTIRFYANNSKGMVGQAEVSIVKSLSINGNGGTIFGFDLLVISGIFVGIGLILGTIVWKKLKINI